MIYVTSDIHGNMRRFQSILSQIDLQPEDTLYILGDVIDRHPHGIQIIQYIMHQPNIKMLLGNHEYMMLNALSPEPEFIPIENPRRLWHNNHGRATEEVFRTLSISEQNEVIAYLKSLPLNIDISVNGTQFKLVHGSPTDWYDNHQNYSCLAEYAVWHRIENDTMVEGYTLIFGHTPTEMYLDDNPLRIWYGNNMICIDCGSGYPEKDYIIPSGRLACLRLDDMKEFYSWEPDTWQEGADETQENFDVLSTR